MKLLIDMDVVAYRAAFATEKTKYAVHMWTLGRALPEVVSLHDDAASAKKSIPEIRIPEHGFSTWSRKELQPEADAIAISDMMVGDIVARYQPENPMVWGFLSGVGNFRHGIATRANYKGNRSGTPSPTHLKAVRNHLVSRWGAVLSFGEEADDLIGIGMTDHKDAVCCSIDKDLMQLPGRHYNFVTKEEVTVSRKEADLNFYCQVLSGDPTDNVPGITGIGPVKARKLLAGCTSSLACWNRVLEVYKNEYDTGLGEVFALEAGRLVYVRRKKGEIWNPPSEAAPTQKQQDTKTSGKGRVSERV